MSSKLPCGFLAHAFFILFDAVMRCISLWAPNNIQYLTHNFEVIAVIFFMSGAGLPKTIASETKSVSVNAGLWLINRCYYVSMSETRVLSVLGHAPFSSASE